jgi:hypothetical protein
MLARNAASEGRYSDARRILNNMIKREPDNYKYILALSRLEGWSDNWIKSRDILLSTTTTPLYNNIKVKEKVMETLCYNDGHVDEINAAAATAAATTAASKSIVKFNKRAYIVENVLTAVECNNIIQSGKYNNWRFKILCLSHSYLFLPQTS